MPLSEIEHVSEDEDAISAKVVFKFKISCPVCSKSKEFEAADFANARKKIKKDKKWLLDSGKYYHAACFPEARDET